MSGANNSHQPAETFSIGDTSFEAEVVNFVEKVLLPQGWELIKWTRLPYLCEGDINQAFYWLDDALFVVRPQRNPSDPTLTLETTCPRPSKFWVSNDKDK